MRCGAVHWASRAIIMTVGGAVWKKDRKDDHMVIREFVAFVAERVQEVELRLSTW